MNESPCVVQMEISWEPHKLRVIPYLFLPIHISPSLISKAPFFILLLFFQNRFPNLWTKSHLAKSLSVQLIREYCSSVKYLGCIIFFFFFLFLLAWFCLSMELCVSVAGLEGKDSTLAIHPKCSFQFGAQIWEWISYMMFASPSLA